MAGAFQLNAFQQNAFQLDGNPTFTANAVLFKTISATFSADAELVATTILDTFTADALLNKTIPVTFIASALLARILVQDDFNRTTAANEIGQPSHAGRYHEHFAAFPTEFEGFVNGATWEAGIDESSGVYLSPFTPDITASLEFKILDNDGFAGLQIIGLTVPHETNPLLRRLAIFEIFEQGGGVWHLYAGGSASVTFSPTAGDWWNFKGYFDLTGGTSGAKVWKIGDPEPAAWLITQTRTNWFNYNLTAPQSSNQGQVWLYSSELGNAEIDNLLVQALNSSGIREIFTADSVLESILATGSFTADSVLAADTGTFQAGFTADAIVAGESHVVSFTADAYLVQTTNNDFTVDAVLIIRSLDSISADAWIRGTEQRTFVARSYLVRPTYDQDDQVAPLHKKITFHVQQRRPTALSVYIPPRNTDNESDTDDGGISLPDCLPPCPPYSGSSIGGTNGVSVRRSIYFCDECDIYIYTSSNKMGRGPSINSTGHTGCAGTHSRTLHLMKMFVDYSAIPTVDVGMVAKMVWDGAAPQSVGVKVYANLPSMPTLDDEGQYSASLSGLWTAGDYIGTMAFGATGAVVTDDGTVQFCHIPQSLTVRKSTLSTAIFRFELVDTVNYYGAEFRSPNKPLDIEGL